MSTGGVLETSKNLMSLTQLVAFAQTLFKLLIMNLHKTGKSFFPTFYIFHKPVCVSVNQKNLQVVASGDVTLGGSSAPPAPPHHPTRCCPAPESDSLADHNPNKDMMLQTQRETFYCLSTHR